MSKKSGISIGVDDSESVNLNGLEIHADNGTSLFSKRVTIETDNCMTGHWWRDPEDDKIHSVDVDIWNIANIDVNHDSRGLQLHCLHTDGTNTSLTLFRVDIERLIASLKEHATCL